MATAAAPPAERRSNTWALLPFGVFAVVALTVGLLARQQKPGDGEAQGTYIELLFTSTIHMKAWLATAVALFACAQLFTAAWIYRRLPLPGVGDADRGRPAFHRADHDLVHERALVLHDDRLRNLTRR
jgi:hypothetical protein